MSCVFVYGTLKRGGSNHAFLAAQKFLGPAHTAPGFTLFSLGDYPGLVPSPTDRDGVTGEVWSVDTACLAQLDQLEGTSENLYRRAPIALLPPFDQTTVETYFYLRSVEGHTHLGATWPVGKPLRR